MFNNLNYLVTFSKGTSGFNWVYLIVGLFLLVIRVIVSPFNSGV